MHIAVAILRVPEGLDYSGIIADFDDEVRQQYDVKMNGVENAAFSRHDESSLFSLPPHFSIIQDFKLVFKRFIIHYFLNRRRSEHQQLHDK